MYQNLENANQSVRSSNQEPNGSDTVRESLETTPEKKELLGSLWSSLRAPSGNEGEGFNALINELGNLQDECIELNPVRGTFRHPNRTTTTFFINGINLDSDKFNQIKTTIPEVFGKVVMLVNPPRPSRMLQIPYKILLRFGYDRADDIRDFHEYFKTGFLMFVSEVAPKLAYKLVKDVATKIERQLALGMNVRLVNHSKGAVIATAALHYLRATLPEEKWQEYAPKISVINLGIGLDRFPKGVTARTLMFDRDRIARWSGRGSLLYDLHEKLLSNIIAKSSDITPPIIEPVRAENAHSVAAYMRVYPAFLARELIEEEPGDRQNRLGELVKNGLLSDQTISETLVRLQKLG